MKNRIKKIRKELDLTQQKFADRIGVKRNTVGQWECGINAITDQVITSICREFGVNEQWLRTGEGAMFEEISRAEKAAQIVGAALGSEDDFILNTFIALGQLSPAEWDIIKKFVKKLNDNSLL